MGQLEADLIVACEGIVRGVTIDRLLGVLICNIVMEGTLPG